MVRFRWLIVALALCLMAGCSSADVVGPEEQAREHYLAGEQSFSAGDFEVAATEFELAIRLKPSSQYSLVMLNRARLKLGLDPLKELPQIPQDDLTQIPKPEAPAPSPAPFAPTTTQPAPAPFAQPAPALPANLVRARVVGVSDGDTITVQTTDGRRVKVRLHGIDCPEGKQPFGAHASSYTTHLCYGKEVALDAKSTDQHGRTVANVYLADGTSLNRALVWAGFAWWYKEYAKGDTDLLRLEQAARASRRGLWGQGQAVAPWDFRKAASGSPIAISAPTPRAPSGPTVYITDTGDRYHRQTCRTIRRGATPISLGEARQLGYTRCGVCRP